jgi:sarcosine oxidase
VLCAASWLPELLGDLGLDWRITLSQEQVSYFATPNIRDFTPDRFPMWIWHREHLFYGFPVYGEVAVKAARDMTGRFVTQETRSFEPDPGETDLIASFLRERLPGAVGPELFSKTCVYDMPPDRDFVIDRLPGPPGITIGIGAGHAAKFASLIGKILTDLATSGGTSYPVDAFRADRPALTDPGFEPVFRLAGPRASV